MTGRRFFILSASMGASHDAVAGVLAARLERAGHETVQADVFDLLPAGAGGGLRAAYRTVIERLPVATPLLDYSAADDRHAPSLPGSQ